MHLLMVRGRWFIMKLGALVSGFLCFVFVLSCCFMIELLCLALARDQPGLGYREPPASTS